MRGLLNAMDSLDSETEAHANLGQAERFADKAASVMSELRRRRSMLQDFLSQLQHFAIGNSSTLDVAAKRAVQKLSVWLTSLSLSGNG